MGTSMSQSVSASNAKSLHKNRLFQPQSKRPASLSPNNQYNIFVHKPRSSSQITRFQRINKSLKITKEQKPHQYAEQQDTPVFKMSCNEKFLEYDLTKKINQQQQKCMCQTKILQDGNQIQNNYYILTSSSIQDSQFSHKKKSSLSVDDQLDLCIDSKIQKFKEQKCSKFSPVIDFKLIEKQESNNSNKIYPSKRKVDNLLEKMIIQHKKTGRMLQKYLPKSKLLSKQISQSIIQSQMKLHGRNYDQGQQYFEIKNPQSGSNKKVNKYYVNWRKKRENNNKKQQKLFSKEVLKNNDSESYYDLGIKIPQKHHADIIKKSQAKQKIAELSRKRRQKKVNRLFRSNHQSKLSFSSIRSDQSTKKQIQMLHF